MLYEFIVLIMRCMMYSDKAGEHNTLDALRIAAEEAEKRGIRHEEQRYLLIGGTKPTDRTQR